MAPLEIGHQADRCTRGILIGMPRFRHTPRVKFMCPRAGLTRVSTQEQSCFEIAITQGP